MCTILFTVQVGPTSQVWSVGNTQVVLTCFTVHVTSTECRNTRVYPGCPHMCMYSTLYSATSQVWSVGNTMGIPTTCFTEYAPLSVEHRNTRVYPGCPHMYSTRYSATSQAWSMGNTWKYPGYPHM